MNSVVVPLAAHVRRGVFPAGVDFLDRLLQARGRFRLLQMGQHQRRRQHHGRRIRDALSRRYPEPSRAPPRTRRPSRPCWRRGPCPVRRPAPPPDPRRYRRRDSAAAEYRTVSGRITSCMAALSTISSLYSMCGCLAATSRQQRRNSPSASFMMLALWMAATFLRPTFSA